jgi:BASS family bile acid:Na+ symporter
MNSSAPIVLAINISVVLMVFGMALQAGDAGLRVALGRSSLLLRSLASMFVAMPVLAFVIALYLDLDRSLLIVLMMIALAPVPPVLPVKQIKAGGGSHYVMALLVVSALAAIIVVPAGIEIVGRVFGRDLELPFRVTARVVVISVLLPVLAGLAIARLAPAFAARVAGPVSTTSSALLIASLVPILVTSWDVVLAHAGNFTVVAILLFIATGLLVGHLLGGPDGGDRTALALATATRHPGVAIAVLHVVAPGDTNVVPVVLLYLLVSAVASIPYVKWRQRVSAGLLR